MTVCGNIKLTVTPKAEIVQIMTKYEVIEKYSEFYGLVGDLFSEERRDIPSKSVLPK